MERISGLGSKENSKTGNLVGACKVRQRGKLTIRSQKPEVSVLRFETALPRKGELQVQGRVSSSREY